MEEGKLAEGDIKSLLHVSLLEEEEVVDPERESKRVLKFNDCRGVSVGEGEGVFVVGTSAEVVKGNGVCDTLFVETDCDAVSTSDVILLLEVNLVLLAPDVDGCGDSTLVIVISGKH